MDDSPESTGVVAGLGVDGPEEDSSLLPLSSCPWPFLFARSSSSSNTGSAVCGASSGRGNARDRFVEAESVVEKSHESKVSRNVDEARLRRSWRCVRGGSASR